MVRRALVTVALLLFAAGVWWLWPATLGGGTTYLVTQGVSMEPEFHSGDLALVRPATGYGVGDAVAYRSATLRTVVLHRIVAVQGGGFRLRGDNNSWLDPDTVPPSDVLGRLAGRVPRGGDLLLQARQPPVLALGSALVMIVIALLRLTLRRGGRRVGHATRARPRWQGQQWARQQWGRRARPQAAAAVKGDARRALPPAIMVVTTTGVALLSVGALAWVVPATRVDSHAVTYLQRASLTYRASVPAGPAYPTGELVTGEPVYLALAPTLDVAVSYRVTSAAVAALRGTRAVTAVLSTPDGWSRTMPLVPPGPFRGRAFDVTAHLDLASFARVIHDVETATRVPIGGYTLTVRVDVHLMGGIAGRPVDQRLAPALTFAVDDRLVRLTRTQSAAPSTGDQQPPGSSTTGSDGDGTAGRPQVTEAAGSVRVPERVPTAFSLLGHRILASDLRWWPPAAGGLLLLMALALAGLARRGRASDGPGDPLARFEPHLLHAEQVAPTEGRTVIDLESIDALARVAERYERFILHSGSGPEHDYLVDDGTTLYRYRTGDAAAGAAPDATEPEPLLRRLPRQRAFWEPLPAVAPAAAPLDAGEQVTAFVERLRARAGDQDC